MNKNILKYLIGITAVSLAGCAAYFSIIGLSKLFADAKISIIIMASILEASKLINASFLYQRWNKIGYGLKLYLTLSILIISIITSIGIYGFLSSAYQSTKSQYELGNLEFKKYNTQKDFFISYSQNIKLQLDNKNNRISNLINIRNSQENGITKLIDKNKYTYSIDKSSRSTDNQIKIISAGIDTLNNKLLIINDTISKLNIKLTEIKLNNEVSSELGPLIYVSSVLNMPMDIIVNYLILLFIFVFDPLAIILMISFNSISHNNKTQISNTLTNKNNNNMSDKPKKVRTDNKPKKVLNNTSINNTPIIKEIINDNIEIVETENELDIPMMLNETTNNNDNNNTDPIDIIIPSQNNQSDELYEEYKKMQNDRIKKNRSALNLYSGGISV